MEYKCCTTMRCQNLQHDYYYWSLALLKSLFRRHKPRRIHLNKSYIFTLRHKNKYGGKVHAFQMDTTGYLKSCRIQHNILAWKNLRTLKIRYHQDLLRTIRNRRYICEEFYFERIPLSSILHAHQYLSPLNNRGPYRERLRATLLVSWSLGTVT